MKFRQIYDGNIWNSVIKKTFQFNDLMKMGCSGY